MGNKKCEFKKQYSNNINKKTKKGMKISKSRYYEVKIEKQK